MKQDKLHEIFDFSLDNNHWLTFDGSSNTSKMVYSVENGIIRVKQATVQGYIEAPRKCVVDLTQPTSKSRRGRVQGKGKLTGTLTANPNLYVVNFPYYRKLNSREAFRLMGFSDESYEKARTVSSERQLLKQAGNSISVQVAEEIIKTAFPDPTQHIHYFELCAGIGAFSEAFKNLNYNAELTGYSEIDKHASKSFSAIHGVPETHNAGDMTQITRLPGRTNTVTGGTPCTGFSLAGKHEGGEKGSGTASSLLHDQSRIAIMNDIDTVIWENVTNAERGKHKATVNEYITDLETAGYTHERLILKASNYGSVQNRERLFIISKKEPRGAKS